MTLPRIGNLRAYLAGTGATGALIAGAVVAFLTVGALVAFDDSLLGGDDASGSASLADIPGGNAPESAAAALSSTAGAVAATPAGGRVLAAVTPGADGGGSGATAGVSPGSAPDAPGVPIAPADGGGGPLSSAVGAVDDTTGQFGLPSASPTTDPLTDQADEALNDTLNQVGGHAGNPHLGDDVSNGIKDLLP